MEQYRFVLASNKVPKLTCPYCGARKHWQHYIDLITGEVLPEYYGRCDNEAKCGKWNDPYKDGYVKALTLETGTPSLKPIARHAVIKELKPVNTIPDVYFDTETFIKTLEPNRYKLNTFIQNLLSNVPYPFEPSDVEKVIQLYYIGTITQGIFAGAVTFPFIDKAGNIRAVQAKKFNAENHTTATNWLHSIITRHYNDAGKPLPEWLRIYNNNEKKVSCLFGEHLLPRFSNLPVGLVEAPKTAIYCTLYFGFPDEPGAMLWLAVYNKSSFTIEKVRALKGRTVLVFPDLSKDGGTFREWEAKAKEFTRQLQNTRFIVSDFLERYAPEQDRGEGLDIADYLIKLDWKEFRSNFNHGAGDQNTQQEPREPKPEALQMPEKCNFKASTDSFAKDQYPGRPTHPKDDWSGKIAALEQYFSSAELPPQPVQLDGGLSITDIRLFIDSHLLIVKANNGKATFLPYLNRLFKLEQLLTSNSN
jgi:hypothetical protein